MKEKQQQQLINEQLVYLLCLRLGDFFPRIICSTVVIYLKIILFFLLSPQLDFQNRSVLLSCIFFFFTYYFFVVAFRCNVITSLAKSHPFSPHYVLVVVTL